MAREMQIELVKQWSDWGAGDVVTLEYQKAQRVIAKGYGVKAKKAKPETGAKAKAGGKGPAVETATKNPTGETATVTPSPDGPAAPPTAETDEAETEPDASAGRGGD